MKKMKLNNRDKINSIIGLIFLSIICSSIFIVFLIKTNYWTLLNLEFRGNYSLDIQIFFHVVLIINLIAGFVLNFKNLKVMMLFLSLYMVGYFVVNNLYDIMTPW